MFPLPFPFPLASYLNPSLRFGTPIREPTYFFSFGNTENEKENETEISKLIGESWVKIVGEKKVYTYAEAKQSRL